MDKALPIPSTPSRTSSEPGKSNSEKKENENKYIPPSPLHVILYTILLSLDQEYHQISRFTETQLNTLFKFSVFFITKLFPLENNTVFPQAIFTIFSAGPYSGKSYLLDEILSSYKDGILIDPDRLLVLLIKHGFNVNLQSTKPEKPEKLEIIIGEDKYKYFQRCMDFANYSKFRRWLNTLTEVLINYYIDNKVNVFSPQIIDVNDFRFLKPIQERGIKILLVFIYASDYIVLYNREKREKEIKEANKTSRILQAPLSPESFDKLTTKHKHSSSPEGILRIKDGLSECNIIKVSVTTIGLVYRYFVRCDDTTYDAKKYIISYLISYLTSISKDTSPLSHLTCSLEE